MALKAYRFAGTSTGAGSAVVAFIVADTEAELLALSPANGALGIAKDTGALHKRVSDDWSEVGAPGGDIPDASTTEKGKVELATDGESAAGLAVQSNDGRLSNARTPTSHSHATSDVTGLDTALTGKASTTHATAHKSGGADVIKLDELAAPTDVTTLNVSTSAHGLAPKLPNDATKFLDGTGAYAVPPAGGLTQAQVLARASLRA